MKLHTIRVVAAVIIDDTGRLLLGQRPEGKDYPLTWECPGGKVEEGESEHEAIRRELQEELGITHVELVPQSLITVCIPTKRQSDTQLYISFYRTFCHDWGSIGRYGGVRTSPVKLYAHVGLGWFRPEELMFVNLTPGNEAARPMLLAELGRASAANV